MMQEQSVMDSHQQIHTRNMLMVDELEYEDDVFYSELRKQVLQLTAEDDDDEQEEESKNTKMIAAAQRKGLALAYGYYDWAPPLLHKPNPPLVMNLWTSSGNGTGVFIPQIVQSKKKNRPRRKRNERGTTYRRVDKN